MTILSLEQLGSVTGGSGDRDLEGGEVGTPWSKYLVCMNQKIGKAHNSYERAEKLPTLAQRDAQRAGSAKQYQLDAASCAADNPL
jgi:hypothetical protein